MDDRRWLTPRDFGGRSGRGHHGMIGHSSPHHEAISLLVKRGHVERRKLHQLTCSVYAIGLAVDAPCRCAGSCRYRRTAAGRVELGIDAAA